MEEWINTPPSSKADTTMKDAQNKEEQMKNDAEAESEREVEKELEQQILQQQEAPLPLPQRQEEEAQGEGHEQSLESEVPIPLYGMYRVPMEPPLPKKYLRRVKITARKETHYDKPISGIDLTIKEAVQ